MVQQGKAIGDQVSMPEIQRPSAGAAQGLTTAGEPFAGVLEPHVFFGADDLIGSGINLLVDGGWMAY